MNNVYYRKEDMLACINQFYEDMIDRSETMKQHLTIKQEKIMLILVCLPIFLFLMNMWQ